MQMASADVSNAFYNMRVPDSLARLFRLPALRADLCGQAPGLPSGRAAGAAVQPYLTVLPMGWSWALHFCQRL
eukprot:761407-Lingulodinium_polyedra.AAC.1